MLSVASGERVKYYGGGQIRLALQLRSVLLQDCLASTDMRVL